MNPQDFDFFKSRVSKFISGGSSGIRFGSSLTPRYSRLSNIIPRRALPQQVLQTIQRRSVSDDDGVEASTRNITSLGKITVNLEQTKNNLEKILQIIAEDYKNTQEINRKEIDDYRKRIANRGRIFGKRELGDRKVDILGGVKKYVGSFFSGAGGAIRALAAYNLLQAFIDRDPLKVLQSLMGIGLTYLPAIGGIIAGGVAKSLIGSLFKGGGGAATASAAGTAAGASRFGKFGKLAGGAALIGGGAALISNLFNKPQEDTQQQRLEQLTEQQKGLVDTQGITPLPQDDLRRFENLNRKFEEALDFLIKKQREGGQPRGSSGGGGGTPTPTGQLPPSGPGIEGLAGFIAGAETGGRFDAFAGDMGKGDPNITNMTLSQLKQKYGDYNTAVGAYQFMPGTAIGLARQMGLDPNTTVFNPEMQKRLHMFHLNQMGYSDFVAGKISKEEFGKRIAQQYRALPVPGTGATYQDQYASRNRALRTDAQFLQALEAARTGMTSAPTIPVAPTLPRRRQGVSTPPQAPTPTFVPIVTPPQQQSPQPVSNTVASNDNVPSIDTTYPENFLALYSKLIYQVV